MHAYLQWTSGWRHCSELPPGVRKRKCVGIPCLKAKSALCVQLFILLPLFFRLLLCFETAVLPTVLPRAARTEPLSSGTRGPHN